MSLYSYKARLAQIIDDDALLVYVDLGFYIWTMVPVRLTGLENDNPDDPQVQKRQKQAVAYLEQFFADTDTITIETHIHDNGCWQADIIADGRTVNLHMERLGLLRGSVRALGIVH